MEEEKTTLFRGRDTLFILYEMAILMLMFSSMQMTFTWSIPNFMLKACVGFITLLYWIYNRDAFLFDGKKMILCILFTVICLYRVVFGDVAIRWDQLVAIACCWLCGMSVILSSVAFKQTLLKLFTKALGVILLISVPAWILYLMGFPLPHGPMFSDGVFYVHTNYYFFQVNNEYSDVFPRFASMFQEPGHVATTAVFLICANNFNFRKWELKLMLVAVILSFSLAGYGLLIGALVMFFVLNSKHQLIYTTIFVVFLTAIAIFSYNMKQQNNLIYEFIISRLEFSGGEMKGNNRLSDTFQLQYRNFSSSNDIIFGEGKELIKDNARRDWTIGSAGLKRYIVYNGYVGLFITLLFYALMVPRKKVILPFLAVFLLGNYIRDYPLREYWLYIFIVAMTTLPLLEKKKTDDSIATVEEVEEVEEIEK